MAGTAYDAATALARAARRLDGPRGRLPALFVFTDPDRLSDPLSVARTLPRGCGIVLRHFGRPDQIELAGPLAAVAGERSLILLIAADPELAESIGAAGVHWPEARAGEARGWRRRRPDWIQTASAHDAAAIRRAQRDVDAVFLSPVFASTSPSAGAPIGRLRAGALARRARRPVYALGGVDARTIKRLRGLGFAGAAVVSAIGDEAPA
ncbi:thiamine phosphate synthase [Marinicauda salina]|nr:thiamine phosphate synthase [Marinicauda salina]